MKLAPSIAQWKADCFFAGWVLFAIFGALFVTLIWTLPVWIVADLFDNDPTREISSDWGFPAWIVTSVIFGPGIFRKMIDMFKQSPLEA